MNSQHFSSLVETIANNTGLVADKNLEEFTLVVLATVTNLIIDSDPNEKLILHEPYRTVMNNIDKFFFDGVFFDGSPVDPTIVPSEITE